MNYTELDAARLEIEFFDNPNLNYDDDEHDIIDVSCELSLSDEDGGDLWDEFIDQYTAEFNASFHDDEVGYIEYEDEEDLCNEILKYADKFARIILDWNDCLPAYKVMVSINAWGTGGQYDIDNPIEAIE